MAGHSKWANIKHRKSRQDEKKGRIWTRLIKEITVAARLGGGDINSNPRLRFAVNAAKTANCPKDNIERAIAKGTGTLEGVSYVEANYEGYGPGGVAIFIEATTDNKNRTVGEIRHMLTKAGGNMGEAGCVAWMFSKKGLLLVSKEKATEEQLMEIALEAGADDVLEEGEFFQVTTDVSSREDVHAALEGADIEVSESEIVAEPSSTVELEGEAAEKCMSLIENLEEHDDVDNVFSNLEVNES